MDERVKIKDPLWKILIVISLVFCLFHIFLHSRAPTHDGDSFEYAGMARSLYRMEGFKENLLRSYTIIDQKLPHPAAQRANLYSVALVPFYAVFRESQWTFLVPTFIAIFLLPLVVFRAGKKLFGSKAAFIAALLALFSPGLLRLYTLMDPGLPEAWQMIFYILFVSALFSERYATAGLLMALAFLFKRNSFVLIPATLIWMFFFRRKKFFGVPIIKVFGVAGIVVLPFLIRSWIVFGKPTYTEQFEGISRVYGGLMIDRFDEYDLFGVIFNYEGYNEWEMPVITKRERFNNFMRVIWINVKLAILGKQTSIFYMPGVFQTIGFLVLPFLVLGARGARGSPEIALILTILVLQVMMHIIMAIYSDRYLLCILPIAFLVAGKGMVECEEWAKKHAPFLTRRGLAVGIAVFIILSDTSGFIVMNSLRLLQSPEDEDMIELRTTCDYIRKQTQPGTVVMSYPFFSTQLVCDRPTAPLPYGTINTTAKVIKKYNAKYLILNQVWPVDLFPELPFAKPIARGKKISFYKIDYDALDNYIANHDSYFIDPINLVGYFLSNRFDFEMSPPIYKIIVKLCHSYIAGIILYLMMAFIFVAAYQRTGKLARGMPMAVIIIGIVIMVMYSFSSLLDPLKNADPQISIISAEKFIETLPEKQKVSIEVFEEANNSDRVVGDLKSVFENVRAIPADNAQPAPGRIFFMPVPGASTWLSDEYKLLANIEIQSSREKYISDMRQQYAGLGFQTETIFGGIFIY
ncbi:MAG TPA: glycosyltransferase family 39 protein [bacterium]|nr:glycosyltransferase family 39 protein [bacterium]